VLEFKLRNIDNGTETSESSRYPIGQTKCTNVASVGSVVAGTSIVPVVQAILGKEQASKDVVLYDPASAAAVTYVCKGTTLDFACEPGPLPPTPADVAKEVGEFILGFVDGLGEQIGFADCLADIDATYTAIKAAVDFFESGFKHVTPASIFKAFELIGETLKDFGKAIGDCAKDASALAAKVAELASALSGNAAAIIKVVVEDLMHVWHERKEITDDCKTTVADWRAGDFKGAGKAVGDIAGILIDGLVEEVPALDA